MVFAVIDQETAKVFDSKTDVPEGAIVFESPEELAAQLSASTLDSVRESTLGQGVAPSATAEEAATKLWEALRTRLATPIKMNFGPKMDKLGNMKFKPSGPIELIHLCWEPGVDPTVDFFVKKLPKQAKALLDNLILDGKGVWFKERFDQLLTPLAQQLSTQEPKKLINYHRGKMTNQHILRNITYAEFLAHPKLSSIELDHPL